MRVDRDPASNWKPEDCDPGTMEGYKYLVYGERVRLQKPEYVLRIISDEADSASSQKKNNTTPTRLQRRGVQQPSMHSTSEGEDTTRYKIKTTTKSSSLITLDKIWRYRCGSGEPNKAEAGGSNHGKDISMAFALSRVLRAKLQDVMLQKEIRSINRKLVKARIIEERDQERAFRITELQLAFVNDYFNSRYPMVFWSGLSSLFISLLLSVATIGVVCWLSVDVYKVVQGNNAGKFITLAFMLLLVFKEIWEVVIYLLSDWTRVLLVCMYVKGNGGLVRNRYIEHLVSCVFRSKISDKRWHGRLDQYVFMQSYNDRPTFCNLIHKVTLGMFPEREDGATLGRAIHIPRHIKPMILDMLRVILGQQEPCAQDHLTKPPDEGSSLPSVIMTLCECTSQSVGNQAAQRKDLYGWACYNKQSSSHVILVWHIATSICEMALAKKHGVDMRKPGFLRSLLSYFTCCCSKPYLIDVDDVVRKDKKKDMKMSFTCFFSSKLKNKKKIKLAYELEKSYIVANSLSRYCAYLLISKPDLIPDSYLVPEMVFQAAVTSARDDILKGCDSLETRYTKLMLEAYRTAKNSDNVKMSDDVLRQGAMLGKQLLDYEGDEGCWEILAKVWTELLIHIAPTWNAAAHKDCLESGGEFINIIWALLWHCGIEKSELWPEDDASKEDVTAAPRDNDDAGRNSIPAEEEEQAGAETRDHPMEIGSHKDGEVKATEDPDTANLRPRPMVGTGSSEIEEASQDAAGAGTNVDSQNRQQIKG